MRNLDDVFYPYYLDFYGNKEEFYSRNINAIRELFKEFSNGGDFWFKYTKAKDGNYCYAVDVVYKNRLIKNRVGYRNESVALMSIIDALRFNEFEF